MKVGRARCARRATNHRRSFQRWDPAQTRDCRHQRLRHGWRVSARRAHRPARGCARRIFEVSEAKRWLLGGYNHGFLAGLPHPIATEMALISLHG